MQGTAGSTREFIPLENAPADFSPRQIATRSTLQVLPSLTSSGAAATREITRALRPEASLRGSASTGDLQAVEAALVPSPSLHKDPQGFRRHFVETQRGLKSPLPTFADRLLHTYGDALFPLLGYYAGDSDDDDEPLEAPSQGQPTFFRSDEPRRASYPPPDSMGLPLLGAEDSPPRDVGASPGKVVLTLLKSMIASAILFLPRGFSNGGWLAAMLTLNTVAAIAVMAMARLVDCAVALGGSIGDIGFKTLGRGGRWGVQTAIMVSQMAFCSVYAAFVAANVSDLLQSWGYWSDPSSTLLVAVQFFVLVPLNFVRRLRYFAISNLVADLFIVVGLLAILGYAVHLRTETPPSGIQAFNSSSYPVFLGTSVYAFEGVGVIIPIYQSGNAEAKRKFKTILVVTMAGVVMFMTLFGLVCYLSFGGGDNGTHTVITFNLPCGASWVYTIQLSYCVALILTNPVMMFPAVRIVEDGLTPLVFHAGKPTTRRKWGKNLVRAMLVIVTLATAIGAGSSLDNFVSLIGSVACVPLAFIFPGLMHLRAFPKQAAAGRAVDLSLILFGAGVLVYSTYVAISTWGGGSQDSSPCLTSAAGNATQAV